MLAITLLVVAGCAGTKGAPVFPVHARPYVPRAIVEPQEVFLKCGDDYFCIDLAHLNDLRVYIIEMDSLVRKYENATKELNGR